MSILGFIMTVTCVYWFSFLVLAIVLSKQRNSPLNNDDGFDIKEYDGHALTFLKTAVGLSVICAGAYIVKTLNTIL